uniref:Ovule protein n=1 Tax=Meloidogyne incognita TaxID=6306 RepID=A0A914MCJ6_MELIC
MWSIETIRNVLCIHLENHVESREFESTHLCWKIPPLNWNKLHVVLLCCNNLMLYLRAISNVGTTHSHEAT